MQVLNDNPYLGLSCDAIDAAVRQFMADNIHLTVPSKYIDDSDELKCIHLLAGWVQAHGRMPTNCAPAESLDIQTFLHKTCLRLSISHSKNKKQCRIGVLPIIRALKIGMPADDIRSGTNLPAEKVRKRTNRTSRLLDIEYDSDDEPLSMITYRRKGGRPEDVKPIAIEEEDTEMKPIVAEEEDLAKKFSRRAGLYLKESILRGDKSCAIICPALAQVSDVVNHLDLAPDISMTSTSFGFILSWE